MAEGGTLTAAQGQIARALGVRAAVLPMCEEPVRHPGPDARAAGAGLQEFLIVERLRAADRGGRGRRGSTRPRRRPRSWRRSRAAEAIVIGPSNPVISIGPILAVPGMREAIAALGRPVIAVSPFVAGRAVKGPTEKFMAAIGTAVDGRRRRLALRRAARRRWSSTRTIPTRRARGRPGARCARR